MKPVFSSTDGNRCRLIYCRCHTTCRKTVPDQLIQPEQISAQRILDYGRRTVQIRWTDCFMGILDFCSVFLCIYAATHIIGTIICTNVLRRCCLSLLRYTSGIGTQISNESHSSAAFDIHTLVQLLRQTHRFLSRKIQMLTRFLLQGTCPERKRRLFGAFTFFHFQYFVLTRLNLF